MMNVYNKSTHFLAKAQQGFLLLEAIVAVAVFGILLLSISGYYVRMHAQVTRASTIQKLMDIANRCSNKKGIGNLQGTFIEAGCTVTYTQHNVPNIPIFFVRNHFDTKIVTIQVTSPNKKEEICITKTIT